MILKMFAVFDNKACAFLPPFFMANSAVAERAFADAVNDPTHQFSKNPTDYALFGTGEFNDETGVVSPELKFANYGLASNYIREVHHVS